MHIEHIEEKLQIFVRMYLLKSISFNKQKNVWKLELNKPEFCNYDKNLHRQYPCPTCSAVLTVITRALKEKIRIYGTTTKGEKITFYLNFIKKIDR